MTHYLSWHMPLRRRDRLAEGAGWLLSCTLVTTVLGGTLIWTERQAGDERGVQEAIILELEPLPPVAAIPAPPPSVSAVTASLPDALPPAPPQPPDNLSEPDSAFAPMPEAMLPDQATPDRPPVPAMQPSPERDFSETADPALAKARPVARPERERAIKAVTPAAELSSSSAEAASTQPQSSAASRAGATDAKAQWGAAIRKRVERRKAYPKAAQGANGEVVVRMVIGTTGSLESVSVTRSSGNVELDKAALAAVRRAGRFPKAPEALEGNRHVFSLPIRFSP